MVPAQPLRSFLGRASTTPPQGGYTIEGSLVGPDADGVTEAGSGGAEVRWIA